jgi:transcriptional regulator
MKGGILAVLCVLLVAAAAAAQDAAGEQLLKKLGFADAEIDQIAAIQEQSQAEIQKARAELGIAKAQLSKLLLNVDAGMREIEKAVRAATEWEVQVKLAEITRELKLRKLIGDKKWQKLVQGIRQRQEAIREKARGRADGADARPDRPDGNTGREQAGDSSKRQRARALLKELLELLGETD